MSPTLVSQPVFADDEVFAETEPGLFRGALVFAAVLHAAALVLGRAPLPAPYVLEPEVVHLFEVLPTPRVRVKPVEPPPRRLPEQPAVVRVAVPEAPEPIVPLVVEPFVALPPDVALVAPLPIPDPPAVPADFDGPIEVGGRVLAPQKLHAPSPVMPQIAIKLRREGDVVLEAIIDRAGQLTGLEVVSGPGFGLEQAALDAVRTWRFAPATLDDQPVAVRWRLVVTFRIAGR